VSDLILILERLDWASLIDIGLVALIFFGTLYLVRGTQAATLLRGVVLLVAIGGLLGSVFNFPALGWLLNRAALALLVAAPVIFQPELRRALERLGRAGPRLSQTTHDSDAIEHMINAVSEACAALAKRRHGALIVFERETGLQSYADTGIALNAEITSELLQTIFYVGTTLHDGAVILRDSRILAAACILPLTSSFLSDRRMGLRHRAAIGITEGTDAIAVVVSEEHGYISIVHNGKMIRRIDARRLEDVLRTFYQAQLQVHPPRLLAWLPMYRSNGKRVSSATQSQSTRVPSDTNTP
jgi:diadenylate cyclase